MLEARAISKDVGSCNLQFFAGLHKLYLISKKSQELRVSTRERGDAEHGRIERRNCEKGF
jgi:hypothetical protein